MKSSDFTIIIDTREQHPWAFDNHVTAKRKLDTGDYSIEGLEDLLCIERKKSASEFANNIVESRFKDLIFRMSNIKYSFLLLEFDRLSKKIFSFINSNSSLFEIIFSILAVI
jgi:ERCC4-type nuclease